MRQTMHNEMSKICERQPSKSLKWCRLVNFFLQKPSSANFNWSILEFIVQYIGADKGAVIWDDDSQNSQKKTMELSFCRKGPHNWCFPANFTKLFRIAKIQKTFLQNSYLKLQITF